jgi:hypothetical protein
MRLPQKDLMAIKAVLLIESCLANINMLGRIKSLSSISLMVGMD